MPQGKQAALALLANPAMMPSTARVLAKKFANNYCAQLDMGPKIRWENDDPLAEESIINIRMILAKIIRNLIKERISVFIFFLEIFKK